MDEAAECRRAARVAVRDIEPDALRDVIESVVDDGPTTPGALTLLTAGALGDPGTDAETRDPVAERAAGVQLIYDGLSLIRELAHTNPWAGIVTVDGEAVDDDPTEDNLRMLAADVMVARGFSLLANTDAAGKAVETVRSFGRDQTVRDRPDADADTLDAALEKDVLELALVAGATAVDTPPTSALLATAADVARAGGTPLAPPEGLLPKAADLRTRAETPTGSPEGSARTTATDP
jgi:hypothetical protein